MNKIISKILAKIQYFSCLDLMETLGARKHNKKISVFKGGSFSAAKDSCVKGTVPLLFNRSNYMGYCPSFIRPGVLRVMNGATLNITGDSDVAVRIQQGAKIDVFPGAVLEIGENTFINDSCRIGSKSKISIGKDCLLGDCVSIHDFDGHKIDGTEGIREVIIGDHVWLGEGVTVLKGVKIGEGSVVGAGSLVCKDIPPACLAVGSPAKVLKENITWES